jgi:hypothetical protein
VPNTRCDAAAQYVIIKKICIHHKTHLEVKLARTRIAIISYIAIIIFFMLAMLIEHVFYKHMLVTVFTILLSVITIMQMLKFTKTAKSDFDGHVPLNRALDFYSVVFGALLTYWLVKYTPLSPVVASSVVGILGAFLYKKTAVATFCGSFVGMSSPELFSTIDLTIAAAISGVLFVEGKPFFSGVGGKLGTTAFFGNVVVILFKSTPNYQFVNLRFDIIHRIFDWKLILVYMFWGAIASYLTYWFSKKWLHNIVLSSSLVGLAGGLILPAAMPHSGYIIAIVVYCASFAGMTGATRFKKGHLFLVAGAISGLIFFNTIPIFVGLGGKLGTIGFVSSLFTLGLAHMYRYFYTLRHNAPN